MKFPGWLWFVFAIAIFALPIFGCLDALPIQLWDESRVAINAYELYKAKQWIVTTYNDLPDMWNTKPPLLIWMQVMSFKIFGVSELALRLPSAIAGAVTCLGIFYVLFKKLDKPAIGLLAILVLVSSMGFIKYNHSPRTGDYDALLTCFSSLYCLLYFLYLDEDRRTYLLSAIVLMALAVMTKTIAGLLLTPGLLLYTLYKRKLLTVLKAPQLYIGIAILCAIVGGYYYIREQYTPGYFAQVMENDLLGRFAKSNAPAGEYVEPNPKYYFVMMVDEHFNYWYLLAIAGAVFGLFSIDKRIKDITVFSLLIALPFLLIISKGVNKSNWYDMQAYPFLAILAAIGTWSVCRLLYQIDISQFSRRKDIVVIAFLAVICIPAYSVRVYDCLNADPGKWIEYNTNVCKYLKDTYHGTHSRPDSLIIVKDHEYLANIEWYLKVLRDKNVYTQMIRHDEINPYSQVVTFQPHIKAYVVNNFYAEEIEHSYKDVNVYRLNGRKQQ